jgi:hypothetical protein
VVIWIRGVEVEDGGKGKDVGVGGADGIVIISGEGFEAGMEDSEAGGRLRMVVLVEGGEFVVGLGDCGVCAGFVFGIGGEGDEGNFASVYV